VLHEQQGHQYHEDEDGDCHPDPVPDDEVHDE
jgi:hypothetical protein